MSKKINKIILLLQKKKGVATIILPYVSHAIHCSCATVCPEDGCSRFLRAHHPGALAPFFKFADFFQALTAAEYHVTAA